MKRQFFLILLILTGFFAFAQEGEGGMWLPNEIDPMVPDMQRMGSHLKADDIWDTSKPSLKDAVVRIDNGCTAEFVSGKGLLFTNHHCGYEAIASVSTVEHNYLKDGYWSKSFAEEIPVKGMQISVIDNIKDVTQAILQGVNDDMKPSERQSVIDKNINQYLKRFPEKKFKHYEIKPFYKGNKYYLIERTTYPDVRFVATPPASVGKFGGDTDNWMWPRHTGDFSIFRVYAGPHNEPAEYSKRNKPYRPKKFLKINMNGVNVNDFTMVMGFPGSTDEYLTSYAIKQVQDVRDPVREKVREKTLDILKKHMKESEALRLKLAAKFAHLANYWKFFIGESRGLKKFHAVEAKEKYEREFQKRIDANPEWKAKYGNLLPQLKKLYNQIEKYQAATDIHNEIFYRNIDLTIAYAYIRSLLMEVSSDKNALKEKRDEYKKDLREEVYKSFDPQTDKEVFIALMKHYLQVIPKEFISPDFAKLMKERGVENVAELIYSKSIFAHPDELMKLLDASPKKFVKTVTNDIGFAVLYAQELYFHNKVSNYYYQLKDQINELMRKYMKAQMLAFPEKNFPPDANFTMRVSYGKVRGYQPRDAVYYKPFSHLYGVMEKYIPGDDEFDVPQKLIDLYKKKDYGPYANFDGTMVVDFLATNHITGGNSGSPVLDADGNLIGLAFDGVWEGLMEDLYYRNEISRSIMVDIRYVLFIIDKLGNDKHLIQELTFAKKKKPAAKIKDKPVAPVMH